jgi:hypothetical protein
VEERLERSRHSSYAALGPFIKDVKYNIHTVHTHALSAHTLLLYISLGTCLCTKASVARVVTRSHTIIVGFVVTKNR